MSELGYPEVEDPSTNRHTILRDGAKSALFIFESCLSLAPTSEARIFRFYRKEHCLGMMDEGQTLGRGFSSRCALITKACPGDIIALGERPSQRMPLAWRYYRIGADLECTPLASSLRKLSHGEINGLLMKHSEESLSLIIDKDDISIIFSEEKPRWMRMILNAQLLNWHQESPCRYYEHTKCLTGDAEIQRCVDLAPYVALEKWSSIINKAQLDLAIRSSPAGAVRFAINDIPCSLRAEYLRKNPSAALEQHSKLSDSELHLCAKEDPRNALLIRSMLRPEQNAIILATCYTSFIDETTIFQLEAFKAEIECSIIEFPTVWVTEHAKRFGQLVAELEILFSYRLEAEALRTILENVELPEKVSVANYIAANV